MIVNTKNTLLPNSEHLLLKKFNSISISDISINQDPIILTTTSDDDSVNYYRAKAEEYHQQVSSQNAYVSNLNNLLTLELPVGIASSNEDPNYAIIITQVKVNAQGAFVEAYLLLTLPNANNTKIAFRGKNIRFSQEGGLAGEGRLELVGDYNIPLGDKIMAWLLGKGNTFVEFDCNGFKEIGLEAEVQFSRDLIIPELPNGNLNTDLSHRVKTKFIARGQSWTDIMVGVTLPPFQINGLKDFGFNATEAYLDWSDLANPPQVTFPASYTSPFLQSGSPNLWHGIYMKKLEVRLPKGFMLKSDTTIRTKLGVEHMLLDEQGFTGVIFVEGSIIDVGDMKGWDYSLNKVAIGIVTNEITGFELAGKISVPIIKQKNGDPTNFNYTAQRNLNGEYMFAVQVENNLTMPILVAELNLAAGSSITVQEKDDSFYPTMLLNGSLNIKGTGSGPKAELLGIQFEGMRISTEHPKFDVAALGFGRTGDQQKVSKFPVSITGIMVRREENRFGIGFDLQVNVAGNAQAAEVSGIAGLIVWAKNEVQEITGPEGEPIGIEDDWTFDKIELTAIAIRYSKPDVIEIDGMIRFFEDDPTYGDGFTGRIRGIFGKLKAGFEVYALFGRTDTYRYWFADALVELGKVGVPLVPGVLNANAFGGGYYHRMQQSNETLTTSIGITPSGIRYIPNQQSRGVRAMMKFATPTPELLNGIVTLEIAMNSSGGINMVTLAGNATLLGLHEIAEDKVKELAGDAAAGNIASKLAGMLTGQVCGSIHLTFDNVNDVFHGNIQVIVNVAGGVVRGISSGNRAGWAVIHFEQNDWQILVGTPDQPLGLNVAGIFQARSYFMAGKNVPGSPPPPSQVSEILGNVDLDYMRNMNDLESGTGLAFGMGFIVDTGDLRFLMFYGRFAAGVGFDMMLKDYSTNYHCAGSTGPMGINGWFANGQAYAFVAGKIGVRVNLKFYKGDYDILSLGAAAVMQAKGPNPFWMKGTVGGYFKILGGLVKGNCRFEVTVGEECIPVGEQDLLANVNMIAELSPANGSEKVDVFTTPQVAFNIPVGEIFEITDVENIKHYYKAMLDEFKIETETSSLAGTSVWNEAKDVVVFNGQEVLPGESKITVKVKLSFQERINGIWALAKFDNQTVEEVATLTFETDKAPDYIPEHNVSYSYPIKGQLNFYPQEYDKGFIQLRSGQDYLFENKNGWIQKVRMSTDNGFAETDLTYNNQAKRIDFNMLLGFDKSKVYRFEILSIPTQTMRIDANVRLINTELQNYSGSTDTLSTKTLEGDIAQLEVKSIFKSAFRTSKYKTFGEKLSSITLRHAVRNSVSINVFNLSSYLIGDEIWDAAELIGLNGNAPFIKLEAVTHNNEWYQNIVYPLLYSGYPLTSTIQLTDTTIYGFPPIRHNYFVLKHALASLPEGVNTYTMPSFSSEYIVYGMNVPVHLDFLELQRKAVDYVTDNPSAYNSRLQSIIQGRTPYIRFGPYYIKLKYVIPNISKKTSEYEWLLFNTIIEREY
ncbi:hypothetical protein SanaruYs_34270 [Chryseotalea sanaruensis]|uniref:Uncharacterized protein n=1 Tax=Chryseotalea sanaruensis TaxID=2482724 RepID=A0A401UEA2_9BACT|nr:hypothetical protein SanaruYs_34270 [Chryseotalea sanaruensis]